MIFFYSYFTRYCSADEHNDILGNTNIFFLNNPGWKSVRARLTPFFTSGKMKQMLHLMKNVGAELNDTIESLNINERARSVCTEVKDLCTRFAIDVIASCAYGIEANGLKFPNGDFVSNGKKIFAFKVSRALEFFGVFFFPEYVSLFRFKVLLIICC